MEMEINNQEDLAAFQIPMMFLLFWQPSVLRYLRRDQNRLCWNSSWKPCHIYVKVDLIQSQLTGNHLARDMIPKATRFDDDPTWLSSTVSRVMLLDAVSYCWCYYYYYDHDYCWFSSFLNVSDILQKSCWFLWNILPLWICIYIYMIILECFLYFWSIKMVLYS